MFETQSLKPYLNGTMVQIGVLKQGQPVISFEFLPYMIFGKGIVIKRMFFFIPKV